jgi:hypothetical protein
VYFIVGTAEDGATPATRQKMTAAVKARIVINVVEVVEISATELRKKID